jgi:hypothetical protein
MRLGPESRKKVLFQVAVVISVIALALSAQPENNVYAGGESRDFILIDEDTMYEGDLILEGNDSLVIEGCTLEIRGRINISDHSSLTLRDAKVRLIESMSETAVEGEFWFHMSGDTRFQAVNITIETIFFQSFSIHVSDRVEALFDSVYSLEWYGLVCEGYSRVEILNSTCWSMIQVRDESAVSVRGSKIYGVNVTGNSEAHLGEVYTTRITVEDSGTLRAWDTTVSSDSDGLELVFDSGTDLALLGFPTVSSGIEYEFLYGWSLHGDNEVSSAWMNVTLTRIYLKLAQFVVDEGAKFDVGGVINPHVNIVCRGEELSVSDSTLNKVDIARGCALQADSVELTVLEASQRAKAEIMDSQIVKVSCSNESVVKIVNSELGSIVGVDAAVLMIKESSLPEDTTISGNSLILLAGNLITIDEIDNRIMNVLEAEVEVEDGGWLKVVMNRDRIKAERNLAISLDGGSASYDVEEEKDLRTVSVQIPSGTWRLSVSLGPMPPERVPFFLTPVGQQLISFMIILALVVAVLLAWR